MTPYFIALILTPAAFAVVQGKSLAVPGSADEALMRKATVRIVELQGNGRYRQHCTGVTSGPTEVTTAGHCFSDRTALEAGRLFAEINDPRSPGRLRRIQILAARGGSLEKPPDLALVKLKEETGVGVSVPIALSGCDEKSPITALGFGIDENGDSARSARAGEYAEVAREDQRRILELEDLAKSGRRSMTGSENWIVLRSLRGNMCYGDSGGPIFCRSKGQLAVVAVNSFLSGTSVKRRADSVETCKAKPFLGGNRVSKYSSTILRWRRELDQNDQSRRGSAMTNR